jgi:hypothetical protein
LVVDGDGLPRLLIGNECWSTRKNVGEENIARERVSVEREAIRDDSNVERWMERNKERDLAKPKLGKLESPAAKRGIDSDERIQVKGMVSSTENDDENDKVYPP